MRILVLLIIGLLAAGQAGADRNRDGHSWQGHRSTTVNYSEKFSQRSKQHRKSRYSARLNWLKTTRTNSGVCDELKGASRGLRMMCMAFCEMQACSPDYTAADPFESCPRSSKWILARYEDRRGPGDPDMPCVKQPAAVAECPCWTREELAGLRSPSSVEGERASCSQNLDAPTSNIANYDSWYIFGDQGTPSAYSTTLASFGSYGADSAPSCQIADTSANISRMMSVTPEQFAACEADVAQSAIDRGLACEDMTP